MPSSRPELNTRSWVQGTEPSRPSEQLATGKNHFHPSSIWQKSLPLILTVQPVTPLIQYFTVNPVRPACRGVSFEQKAEKNNKLFG